MVVAVEVPAVRRRVIEDAVEDQMDAPGVRGSDERRERGVSSQRRIDVHVVGRVVAMIRPRIEDRRQPDRGDAERLQEVELLRHAFEVAAEEVAIEDAGFSRVLDRLVPGGMSLRLDVGVEGRAAEGRAGPAVVVGRIAVAEAIGEDLVDDRPLQPRRRRERARIDRQLEPVAAEARRLAGASFCVSAPLLSSPYQYVPRDVRTRNEYLRITGREGVR